MTRAIEVLNLTKSYKTATAIKDVTFTVDRGAAFGYLGPQGSGKTTTIRILMGLIKPDSGSYKILGTDPSEEGVELLSRVRYVPENPGLPRFMTGYEFLELMGKLFGLTDLKDEIERVLDIVGARGYAHKEIGKYSRGMRQRILIAQALLGKPELLVLDEPLAGIDVEGIIRFRELFKSLNGEGVTLFLSTHVLSYVEKLCTHLAIISRGRLRISGEISSILKEFDTDDLERAFLRAISR